MRINHIKSTKWNGKQHESTSNEDPQEIGNERILLERIINNTEGLDPRQVARAMKRQMQQMKGQGRFTEVDGHNLTPQQQGKHHGAPLQTQTNAKRSTGMCHCVVAKGFTEQVTDIDLSLPARFCFAY